MNEQALHKAINKRKEEGMLRTLRTTEGMIDFCSNDYLGFAHSDLLRETTEAYCHNGKWLNGSTGSRLLSGNLALAEETEALIANFHNAEAALLFNSGYDANIGFFSSVPQRGDTILYDELIHASIHDGRRLSLADSFKFRHNDTGHLEEHLQKAAGEVYVAVESVYSMDGDIAPLREISELCSKYNAFLVVDEAHATGVLGEDGRGLVSALKLENEVFARLHTFGKALGCHGAAITGSRVLREYLINFARSFIYTTALPPHSLLAVKAAYELLPQAWQQRDRLQKLITCFRERVASLPFEYIESNTAVQCIVIPGNSTVKGVSSLLQERRLDVRPILSPTVPKGRERLRICLHSFNTESELDSLMDSLRNTDIR